MATGTEGETLDVEITLENTGDTEDTQDITLNTEINESGSVSNSSTQVQSLASSITADVDLSISQTLSDGQSASISVVLLDSGSTVAENSDEASTSEGQTTVISAQITGSYTFDTIEFSHSGDEEASFSWFYDAQRDANNSVTLSAGQSTTFTLSWTTQGGSAGDYTAIAASDDTTDSVEVTVNPP